MSAEGTRTAIGVHIGVHAEAEGTYVAGMSIKPSEIDLTAKESNAYLAEARGAARLPSRV